MKGVSVFTEDRFGRDEAGVPAAIDGARGSAAWTAYIEAGRPVHVAARTSAEVGSGSTALTGVTVIPLPYYVGIAGLVRNAPRLAYRVAMAVREAEFVVLRVPGPVTSIAAVACRALRRSYAVDVVGDAIDAVDGGALGSRGRILGPLIGRHVRWIVKNAGAARYVTASALQNRYPIPQGRPSVGVSDVRLGAGIMDRPRSFGGAPFSVVTVGTMEAHYKGQDDLIRAIAILESRGLKVQAGLVGGGRLQPDLEALASKSGVADLVRFHGVVSSREELNQILDSADLFVLSSRQEGLPRALVEAMARALPAVATRVGGVPELLSHGSLVPPNDPAALADAIYALLTDEKRWESESAKNLASAREFAEDVLADRFTRWIVQIPAARSQQANSRTTPAPAAVANQTEGHFQMAHGQAKYRHTGREFLKLQLRAVLSRRNLDLVRDPYSRRVARALRFLDIDTVIDVGANMGQFGTSLRANGYRGRILSFEPLPDAYASLQRRAAKDAGWESVNLAVGSQAGSMTIHVAANSHSSSLLSMTEAHLAAAPDSHTLGTTEVRVTTVADAISEYGVEPSRSLLKVDTQGYEAQVLVGAEKYLAEFAAVQLELSYVTLYEGQELADSLVSRLESAGFELFGLDSAFHDPESGRILQADALFASKTSLKRSKMQN